jgi:hypothetical protein
VSVAVLALLSASFSANAAVGAAWVPVTHAAAWQARSGHASVVFNGQMWILGGSPNGSNSVTNDVWSSNNGIDWTQVTAAAPWSARAYHQVLEFDGDMWVIGGWDGVSVPRATDVWFSSNGASWSQATAAAPWTGRNFFGAVVHGGKLWIMGGYSGTAPMNDVWSSPDGVTWTQATGAAPWVPRTAFPVLDYNGKMWVLGGVGQASASLTDVWSSTDGISWTQETASAWPKRYAQSAVVFQGAMWVVGGTMDTLEYADVWTSTTGASWTRVTDSAWPKRWGQTCVAYDTKMWVLGGVDSLAPAIYHDVWYADTGATLTGAVTAAATGAPVACAAIVASPVGGGLDRITTADANGAYQFFGVPQGSYTVAVYGPGYTTQSKPIGITSGSLTYANFPLAANAASGGVRGVVTDADTGKPVPGIRVDALINNVNVGTTYTCADGNYEILGLVAKATTVSLQFSGDSYTTTAQTADVSSGAVTTSNATVHSKFALPGALGGVVTRADGSTAIAGARVTIEGLGNVTELTDSGGAYLFASIPEGRYTVHASALGFGGSTQLANVVALAPSPVDFQLPAAIPNDVNGDGVVNATDVQLVINAALNLSTGYNCDMNKDNAVNAIDVQLVINAALGLKR